jgi:hypothetical protein
MLAEISDRCNAVEECYQFMLAYAAQGLPSDQGSKSGGQVREFLQRAVQALTGSTIPSVGWSRHLLRHLLYHRHPTE